MSLLTIVQNAMLEVGLTAPSSVISNSDTLVKQFLAHATREGKEVRNKVDWPQLIREYTFTLATSTASYAMPADFERFSFMTHWDRSMSWELVGPISSQDWQMIKSGIVTTAPRRRWRFKGFGSTQFFVDPTPDSTDSGVTLVFEYYSKSWCRPRTWVQGQVYGTNSFTFYNGNYYSTVSGGTAGATPPTHTTGSVTDGAVLWAYSALPYETFTADTDVSNVDENIIELGTKFRFLQAKDLPGWEKMEAEYNNTLTRLASSNTGASNVNLNSGRFLRCRPYPVTPETGFGS